MKRIVGKLIDVLYFVDKRRAVNLAYTLFSSPRKGKFTREVPSFLREAEDERFVFLGEEIQCYSWNLLAIDKPLVLLVHGWESNASRWEALQEYFSNDFRIVSFDAFALGQSSGKQLAVPDFSSLIGCLIDRYKPSSVVAHSLGAFCLLNYLAFHQVTFIKNIVLLGCLGRFSTILDYYYAMLGYSEVLQKAISRDLELKTKRTIESFSSKQYIELIEAKVLVVHDGGDHIIPLVSCKAFHQSVLMQGGQVVITEGLGHSTQGIAVYDVIKSFLEG